MTVLEESSRPTPPDAAGRRRDPVMAWSAVGAAVVTFAVVLVPHASLAGTSPSAAQVRAFFTEHHTMQEAQPLLHSVGGVLMLVFLVRLSSLLRDTGAVAAAPLVRSAAAALVAVVVVTMGWVAAVVTLTGDIDGALQWDLYTIGWDFHFRLLYLLPLLLLPTGWALRRAGASGLGWFALVLGTLTAVAPLGYLGRDTWFVQYPAFMLFLVWAAITGAVLGWRGLRTVRAA